MMLTYSYATDAVDEAHGEAQLTEWALREIAYRRAFPEALPEGMPITASLPPARDAGDVCAVCGEIVTWVDHLPPTVGTSEVRCFKNVVAIEDAGVVIDDIFPRL